jgi:hypothetical protein
MMPSKWPLSLRLKLGTQGRAATIEQMNQNQITALARGFAPVVYEHVADQMSKVVGPLLMRIQELRREFSNYRSRAESVESAEKRRARRGGPHWPRRPKRRSG